MILRKHSRKGFTTIDNELLNDPRLSFKARGLAAFLLSKPDDWRIVISHLEGESPQGRAAVISAIKELKELGYYRVVRIRSEDGRRIVDSRAEIADYPAFLQETCTTENLYYRESVLQETDTNTNNGSLPKTEEVPKTEEEVAAIAAPTSPSVAVVDEEKERRQEWFDLMCRLCGWTPTDMTKEQHIRVRTVCKHLSQHYETTDLIRYWNEIWSQRWPYTKDGSRPTPEKVKEQIGELYQDSLPVPSNTATVFARAAQMLGMREMPA